MDSPPKTDKVSKFTGAQLTNLYLAIIIAISILVAVLGGGAMILYYMAHR